MPGLGLGVSARTSPGSGIAVRHYRRTPHVSTAVGGVKLGESDTHVPLAPAAPIVGAVVSSTVMV